MSADIHEFRPEVVGEGFRFDPDKLLEEAKGQGFDRLVIIADYAEQSGIWISGTANTGESLMLMEAAKLSLIKPMLDE